MCGSKISSSSSWPIATGIASARISAAAPSRVTLQRSIGTLSTPTSEKCLPVERSSSVRRAPPGPTMSEAISGSSSTRNASWFDSDACRRRVRRFSIAIVSLDSTRPSPLHTGQAAVMISRTPSVTFWRVISTSPSGEMEVR